MNSVLSFLPDNFQRSFQLYGREDLACNRQHPSPVLKAQHVGKQHQQLKRMRTSTFPRHLSPASAAVRLDTVLSSTTAPPPVLSSAPPLPAPAPMDGQLSIASQQNLPAQLSSQSLVCEAALSADSAMEIKAKNSAVDQIEAHLNLQVLLKHEELRLIETEIAKCQISLEQLRRVHAIPYPDSSASCEANFHAATSSTPALTPELGLLRPQNPPPSGVTDGPYTRHYARWLLPDETFDPVPPRLPRGSSSIQPASSRKRSSLDDVETPKPKRTSTSMFQQLPVANGMSKSLIVQRPGGKWVKIICKLCGKDDSANLQGFTNHTRIKHGIVYPTHLDAMNDCGHELNDEEAAQADAVVGSMSQQQPQAPSAVTTPVSAVGPMVHSLTVGPSRQSSCAINLQSALDSKPRNRQKKAEPKTPSPAMITASAQQAGPATQFIPYLGTPSLSKLLEKRGSSLNLQDLGKAAKQRIDLDQVDPIHSDDETQPSPAPKPAGGHNNALFGSRMPARAPAPNPLETPHLKSSRDNVIESPMQASLHTTCRQPGAVVPSSFTSEKSAAITAQPSFTTHTAAVTPEAEPTDNAPSPSPDGTTSSNPGMIPDDEEEDDDNSVMHQSERDDASTTSAHFNVQDEHEHTHGGSHNSFIFHTYEPETMDKTMTSAEDGLRSDYLFGENNPFRTAGTNSSFGVSGPINPTAQQTPKKKRGRPRKNQQDHRS